MNNYILFPTHVTDSLQQSTPVTSAVRQGSDDENNVTITGVFSRLPMEVTERILAALIPPHHCTQSSFEVHTCTVSYGPIVRAIANINQSCKYFYVLSRTLRRIAHPVYRKEAAALEFSFKTRNWPEVKEDLFDDLSQNIREAKYVRTVQNACRHRYDIDPVTDFSSELPQFAHTSRTLSNKHGNQRD
jgi:hypothetical protein